MKKLFCGIKQNTVRQIGVKTKAATAWKAIC